MRSIFLKLSDSEIESLFNPELDFLVLQKNAQAYREDIKNILADSRKRFQLRKALSKLFSLDNYFYKGKIWLAFGDIRGAEYCLGKLSPKDQNYGEAMFRLGLLTLKDVGYLSSEKAEKYLVSVPSDNEYFGKAMKILGQQYSGTGRKREAIKTYKKIPVSDPSYEYIRGVVAHMEKNKD